MTGFLGNIAQLLISLRFKEGGVALKYLVLKISSESYVLNEGKNVKISLRSGNDVAATKDTSV